MRRSETEQLVDEGAEEAERDRMLQAARTAAGRNHHKGRPRRRVDRRSRAARRPGATVLFASNDARAQRNAGDGPATYFVFNLATAATRKVPLPAPAFDGPSTLPSSVFAWEKLTARPAKTGEYREIVSSPTITLTLLDTHGTSLNPGEVPPPHRHPYEELVVIREGTIEITVNGETQRVGPGWILFFASNDLHGWRNVGPTPAVYHVFRIETAATPNPTALVAK